MKKLLTLIFAVTLLQLGVVSTSHAAPPASGGTYHTVQYGETLFSIGRRYGVNPYYISQVNGLYDPNYIYAGQVLYIPASYGWDGGWNGCNYGCNRQGRWKGNWGNCYSGCGNGYQDGSDYGWKDCYSRCGNGYQDNSQYGWGDCNYGCNRGNRHSKVVQGYGYDYSGYYYYSHNPYRRYSYTCGYYYNCY